jgi:hypothetical protein
MEQSLSSQLHVKDLRVLAWDDDLEDFCVPDSIAEVGPVATIAVCPSTALEEQFGASAARAEEAALTLAEASRSAAEEDRRQFAWHQGPDSAFAPAPAGESPGARFDRLTASADQIHAQLDQHFNDEEAEEEEEEEYVAPMMSKAELLAKAKRQQQKRRQLSSANASTQPRVRPRSKARSA